MRTRKAKDRSRLIQAAMGQIPCDLTIGNVQFFNAVSYTHLTLPTILRV